MLKKVNDFKVKPLKFPKEDKRPVKGGHLIREPYANVFIAARKKSGKTTLIANLIRECIDKRTVLILFTSTLNKDPSWKVILDWAERHEVPTITHTSIVDSDGTDKLAELVEEISNTPPQDEDSDDEDEPPPPPLIDIGQNVETEEKHRPPRKPKTRVPEYFIVLDDLSTELKQPSVTALLKKNRHLKMKIVISSQYPWDLLPAARKQIDILILFKNQPKDKLLKIYSELDLPIDFDLFYKLYKTATPEDEQYSFFYIDTSGEYRKNFDQRFEV